MNKNNIIFLSVIILLLITFFFPKKIVDDQYTFEKKQDDIKILHYEKILEDDTKSRIAEVKGIQYNSQKDCDISIYLDKDPCNFNNYEIVYELNPNFKPDQFQQLFQSQINPISIKFGYKEKSPALDEFIQKLKQSYINNPPHQNNLVFVGCMLLSRWVALRSQKNHDYTYPFWYTYEITKNADLAIGNLETPFAQTGPYTDLDTIFRGDPGLIEGLVYSGFDIVNLANNHFGDSQRAGMQLTFDMLNENNIKYFGAGENQTESRKARIIDLNGIRYAFLGYAEGTFTPNSYASDDEYAGLNLMNIDTISQDVIIAKEQADFVVVSMHAGVEYQHNPSQFQIDFAHKAIDAGADMIYAHHPHVVQGVQYYNDKPIFYSLGNFSMDQLERDTQQGYIIRMNIIFNKITSVELLPYHIYDYSQPKVVNDQEADEIIADIYNSSVWLSN